MKGNSFFKVIDIKTRKVHARYRYDDATEPQKRWLKKRMNQKEIILKCGCSAEIEQRIRVNDLAIYNATNKTKHDESCTKNSTYVSHSQYLKGLKENEDGFDAHVAGIYGNQKRERPETDNEKPNRIAITSTNTSVKQGELTPFGFATLLNMMAWEHAVIKEERLIQDHQDMLRKIYGQSNKFNLYISPRTKKSLKDLAFNSKKIKNMKEKKDFFYVYMKLEEKFEKKYGDKLVHFVKALNGNGYHTNFYIDPEEYESELMKERGHSLEYFIAGFAYKSTPNASILTLRNFALVPITRQGLFVESSYEKEAYEFFCNHNQLFYKPYKDIPEYEKKIPDVMFIKGEERIIGEVFGMNTEDYLRAREEKLRLAEEMKDSYGFWKWDVGQEPLTLP